MNTATDKPRPVLKARTETISRVGYNDLAQYISEVLGIALTGGDLCAMELWGSGSQRRFLVDGRVDSMEGVTKILAGGHCEYCLGDLLNYLASEGHLATGTYLVEVSY